MSPKSAALNLAGTFVISCGVVTIDPERRRVLTVHARGTTRHVLPKGRKNVGETLEAAAIRETHEESGYLCQLVNHSLPTKATPKQARESHQEPIAVQQRLVGKSGARKIIFWYLGEGDSTAEWDPNTQDAHEDFETKWMKFDEALSLLVFEEDKALVRQALCAYPEPLDEPKSGFGKQNNKIPTSEATSQ